MTSSRRHPRHPATVSLDPANKQRDDGCQASCHPSAPFFVIRVAPFLSSQCLTLG
ncbi:hypothetical protein [Wolbachia endosymbiont (group A) of Rhinocyllus conicus]|uniref:hypothetical protein n=1 Tax=Wolbachia endosymbiont (group A) of Rhinocyllus conicus TaxID=2954053 RepID=UPI0022261F19|nr:hypothetical protein [Wolbachia endosymbiont (group A) of Rhinocyllus conicus]